MKHVFDFIPDGDIQRSDVLNAAILYFYSVNDTVICNPIYKIFQALFFGGASLSCITWITLASGIPQKL